MKALLFVLPALVCQAQDPALPAQLAMAQRLSTDQLLTLQAMLAADPAARFPSHAACVEGLRPSARAAGPAARSASTAAASASAIAPMILPQFAAAVAAAAAPKAVKPPAKAASK